MLFDVERILRRDTEADEGSDVSEQAVGDVVRNLLDILMCDRQSEPVLPSLGKDLVEGLGGEILELVDIQEEGRPLVLVLALA